MSRIPKAFKPATLDTDIAEPNTLQSNKQQLWHFTFPKEFDVGAFSELELHLPADPLPPNSPAHHVASFELQGVSYRIIEGSNFETSDLINLFPSPDQPGQLTPGKPFTRSFRICRDITFPAPPKPMPLNRRGRAPQPLTTIHKTFLPIGYMNESLSVSEREQEDRQGRIIRPTSSRPASPRLLPNHGFDINEWGGAVGPLADKNEAKKAKKEKKRTAQHAGEEEHASKKHKKESEHGEKKKKKESKSEKKKSKS